MYAMRAGYYTVLAPTNAALASLPQELAGVVQGNVTVLRRLLCYHVLPRPFRLQDALNDLTLTSLAGSRVRINVYLNASQVGEPSTT